MKKILTIFFILSITFIFIACSQNKESNNMQDEAKAETKVTIDEAKKIVDENEDLVILDVRTQDEYDEGHIKNAILIPYNTIEENIDKIEKYKDKPVLVYCRTGRRSAIAVKTLIDNGFTKIYHMNEGISAWTYDLEK